MINKELKSELRAHRGDLYGEVKISGQVVMIKVVKSDVIDWLNENEPYSETGMVLYELEDGSLAVGAEEEKEEETA